MKWIEIIENDKPSIINVSTIESINLDGREIRIVCLKFSYLEKFDKLVEAQDRYNNLCGYVR